MACSRNETLIKSELIRYISSLGLTVNTVTKARGNKGFFKEGRIDVSKTLDDSSAIRTLIHEYAHYINYKFDKTLSSLSPVFGDESENIKDELLEVTKFVDENALCQKLNAENDSLKNEIKILTDKVQKEYPDFSANSELKEFKKYSRWSNIGYLEKYDKVKIHSITSSKVYSIDTIKEDFPDMPEVFVDYLKLKSKQRRRNKILRRISKLNKYYSEPCELFARFIEGIYIDINKVKELAPSAYEAFLKLFNKNYYHGLREILSIVKILVY